MKKPLCLCLMFLLASVSLAAAGDAFLRFGGIVHPDIGDGFGDRWLATGGSDYEMSRQLFLGFELQFAKYTFADELDLDHELNVAPFNGFANLKFKAPSMSSVRFVGGGGAGLMSSITWNGDSDWNSEFGVHGILGLEFGPEHGTGFGVDFEIQRVIEDNAETQYLVLGGINW